MGAPQHRLWMENEVGIGSEWKDRVRVRTQMHNAVQRQLSKKSENHFEGAEFTYNLDSSSDSIFYNNRNSMVFHCLSESFHRI